MNRNNLEIDFLFKILKLSVGDKLEIKDIDNIAYYESTNTITITPHLKLFAAEKLLQNHFDIEQILQYSTWKDFESFIEEILKEHDFITGKNIRFRDKRTKKLYEIDVIGISYNYGIAIDCKKWKHRPSKHSALRAAAIKQKERVIAMKRSYENIEKYPILKIIKEKNVRMFPIIVTWANEDMDIINGIPIIPVANFNDYLLKFDEFNDYLFSI